MHEVDMTKALIQTLQDWWQAQPDMPEIRAVHLTIGQFTCVEPASLQFAFAAQTQDTELAGVALRIHETSLIAYCHSCQQEYRPAIGQQYACPTCHAPLDDIRSGRELKIDHIEYRQPASVARESSRPVSPS
ncbi:MAG: hydrogenase maturation nickel metallochaperone HypA [Spirulinaceae cyanobacterium RM2_2_10]|nr:hydrogenase maturation nickel metallochaperone HypA [Spirulinaceae cyanobacterium SM2_1_0]NJO20438.1 hydrogenase maturation nickel metallochaperone HypA [Spirulinaceae cyanobacterium RM2_2_10]